MWIVQVQPTAHADLLILAIKPRSFHGLLALTDTVIRGEKSDFVRRLVGKEA